MRIEPVVDAHRSLSAPPAIIFDPDLSPADPRHLALLGLWEAKRRDGRLPCRADFDPRELKQHLGWLCIADVLPEAADLRYRLIGTKIVGLVGSDVTGRLVSEVLPPVALAIFRHLIAERRPGVTYGRVDWHDREYLRHETLLLPLADDGESVDRFLIEMVVPEPADRLSRR